MANPELQLLSAIITRNGLKEAIALGLSEDDFLTDEARAMYQHTMKMRRDPRWRGAAPGVNIMRELYEHFEVCDDASMTIQAYFQIVRDTRLRVEAQRAAHRLVSADGGELTTVLGDTMDKFRRIVDLGQRARSSRRDASSFSEQPSVKELRNRLLVPDLGIGPGFPVMLVAAGFTGKTACAQALTLAVASGQKAWGMFDVRQGRVLHVDAEQGSSTTEQRYRQLGRGMNLDLSNMNNLAVEYRPPMLVVPDTRGRLMPNEAAWEAMVEDHDLVIVDNLSALTPGLQENSSEMRLALDMLGRISERTEATIVVVHHTVKPGPRAARGRAAIRGSSAIFDASTVTLLLERSDPGADHVRVTCEKARGGLEASMPAPFLISKRMVGPDAFVLAAVKDTGQHASSTDTACQRTINALANAGGTVSSFSALRVLTGLGTTPLRAALRKLATEGRASTGRGSISLLA